ncbi:hypothetical protein VQ03_11415 [Methylobacterium tarhaniae]|uniref:Uncharacterized protein n=1 Tax=Methylobacterium tarhaniae TaxID=1187852 RepID=A0A0J6T8K1_9HYPH|nr:hypothetical protein VQ03_11415 [Methylobacterium tarhaniae]
MSARLQAPSKPLQAPSKPLQAPSKPLQAPSKPLQAPSKRGRLERKPHRGLAPLRHAAPTHRADGPEI